MAELPIACSLDGVELAERGGRWRALADQYLITSNRTPGGARQRYRRDKGAEAELRELIALEAECCPFLDFRLDRGDNELVLEVSGPPEALSAGSAAPGGRSSRPGSGEGPRSG